MVTAPGWQGVRLRVCVGCWSGSSSGDGRLLCRLSHGVAGRGAGSISTAALIVFAEEIVGLAEFLGGSRAQLKLEILWEPLFNIVLGRETGSKGPAAVPASAWETVGVAEFLEGSRA